MSSKLTSSRRQFVSATEAALERPLSEEEIRAVRGLDEQVVEIAVATFKPNEFVAMLESICGDPRINLLEQLAGSQESIPEQWQRLLAFVKPTARKRIESFNFAEELEIFRSWFLGLLASEPPPPEIRALNFGLLENDDGCQLYVSGSNSFDEEDSDWAAANDWWPEGRYAGLKSLSKLHRSRLPGVEPWVVTQAVAILLIRAFFEAHITEVKKRCGRRKLHIASGFDDGDLYLIKPATRPKS